jgi:hypothetical protein
MGEASIFHEDDRVELIDGEVMRMSHIGWRHVWCVNALTMLLARLARGRWRAWHAGVTWSAYRIRS